MLFLYIRSSLFYFTLHNSTSIITSYSFLLCVYKSVVCEVFGERKMIREEKIEQQQITHTRILRRKKARREYVCIFHYFIFFVCRSGGR